MGQAALVFCAEELCGRATFAEATDEVPRFARSTIRLNEQVVAAVISSGRAVSEVARAHQVSWWLVQTALNKAAVVLPGVDDMNTVPLGIDEHRYRSVRWFRSPAGGWRRFEPWMTTMVDLTPAKSWVWSMAATRRRWAPGLSQRRLQWRERIEVVAIDPSAPFRKALRQWLPRAAVSVDKFHMVELGNDTVTAVRQRLMRGQHGRRGRKTDTVWAHRMLLLRGADSLAPKGWDRLDEMFRRHDPTEELGAVWGIKEQLRRLLNSDTLAQAWDHRMRMGYYTQIADMAETTKLCDTVVAWWDAIEILIVTGATTAKVEAANTGIKNIKRSGGGFRNSANYTTRILLSSAARSAA